MQAEERHEILYDTYVPPKEKVKYCITVQRSLIENFKVGASQDVLAFFL